MKKVKNPQITVIEAFYLAGKISFSLVFFPVIFLLIAIKLDKSMGTTPLFIILGIVLGLVIGVYQAIGIKREMVRI